MNKEELEKKNEKCNKSYYLAIVFLLLAIILFIFIGNWQALIYAILSILFCLSSNENRKFGHKIYIDYVNLFDEMLELRKKYSKLLENKKELEGGEQK